jgi:hypothetical protein
MNFFHVLDDEVIIKTVSSVEARFLQEILPAYYLNLHQNFRTLLPKFFGFYCYSCTYALNYYWYRYFERHFIWQ